MEYETKNTWHIVSRHPGAIEWLQAHVRGSASSVQVLSHLDELQVNKGDVVCGVVPLAWAARLCKQGARVLVLDLKLSPELRGVELGAGQLRELGARLVEYRVEQVSGCNGQEPKTNLMSQEQTESSEVQQ